MSESYNGGDEVNSEIIIQSTNRFITKDYIASTGFSECKVNQVLNQAQKNLMNPSNSYETRYFRGLKERDAVRL